MFLCSMECVIGWDLRLILVLKEKGDWVKNFEFETEDTVINIELLPFLTHRKVSQDKSKFV